MRPRRLAPALLSALATLALAACGGGGSSSDNGVAQKSADQIVTSATKALESAKSVRVSGNVVSSGSHIGLDLTLLNGKGGKGSMSQDNVSFRLVSVNNNVYINGTPAFWRQFGGSNAAQLLSGKWLKGPASGQLAQVAALSNLQKLTTQVFGSHGKLVKQSVTTVRGERAIGVKDASDGGVLYVSTTGKPYPIEIAKVGSGGGQVVFDRYDQPVMLTAPSKAIDISRLG